MALIKNPDWDTARQPARYFDKKSATSGKTGGLAKVERLKAARPFGQVIHAFVPKVPLKFGNAPG